MWLKFGDIDFSAAHYLTGHPKCGVLHGHTYIVRNLRIRVDAKSDTSLTIDFGDVKRRIRELDHCCFVQPKDYETLRRCIQLMGLKNNLICLAFLSAESIAEHIQGELSLLIGAKEIHFELWEGLHQGVEV